MGPPDMISLGLVWLLAVSMDKAKRAMKIPAVSGPWGTGWDEEPGDLRASLWHPHYFWEGVAESEPETLCRLFSPPHSHKMASWGHTGVTRVWQYSPGKIFLEYLTISCFIFNLTAPIFLLLILAIIYNPNLLYSCTMVPH